MIDTRTRDFIKSYEIKGNTINVTYGTGESQPFEIEKKNEIKSKFDKQITDLQNIIKKAKEESKRRKIHSYLNIGIILASLITLGSVAPGLLPIVSLGSVTAGNGVLYLINKKKIKELDKTANSSEINNIIYMLQQSEKTNKENTNNYTNEYLSSIKNNKKDNISNLDDNVYEEEMVKKVA